VDEEFGDRMGDDDEGFVQEAARGMNKTVDEVRVSAPASGAVAAAARRTR
jgi:hypothetical protein